MKKIIFTLALTSFGFLGCGQKSTLKTNQTQKTEKQIDGNIYILSKTKFAKAIEKKGVQLVDVRTPGEYQDGTIKDAQLIDYKQPKTFDSKFAALDKDKPVYLFCRSGARSQAAAKKLVEMGFKEIYDLEGGYLNWTN
ncbi:rhodanese-like domain-containing protein [Mesonia sediminis]|uniref:Rhodanese-like domain-containing protein n=1 Tax=Mesonia sediminis TaxID=1703946 RepID=A0ABW5SBJ7_9FLAO